MSSTRRNRNFDPIGTVVDWLDACRQRRLAALIDLYDDEATIDCCEGGTFRGRLAVERYWTPKLATAVTGSFEIDALFPEADGVCLDYRNFDGTPARTRFAFTEGGKIRHTLCEPIRQAA
jgi:SnoaL-like protein